MIEYDTMVEELKHWSINSEISIIYTTERHHKITFRHITKEDINTIRSIMIKSLKSKLDYLDKLKEDA